MDRAQIEEMVIIIVKEVDFSAWEDDTADWETLIDLVEGYLEGIE